MARSGGESDKLGNFYESVWTVDVVLDVFLGELRAITVEAFDEKARGVEFHAEDVNGVLHFHSVKRQKQGGDWSIAKICERNKKTGRSILGDLFEKLHNHPTAQLHFVSATGANELRELTERANSASSSEQFLNSLSGRLQSEFEERILGFFDNDSDVAWRALESLSITLEDQLRLVKTLDRRIDAVFYSLRTDGPSVPGDLRRRLAEHVLENLGKRIDTAGVAKFVAEKQFGLRDWKRDKTTTQTVDDLNKRYVRTVEGELINGTQIPRDEVDQVMKSLKSDNSRGVLITAPGGFGKSCVLAQCVSVLLSEATTHLSLRLDGIGSCSTSREIGEQLGLRVSPALTLAGLADGSPCVLIIDQLDAMSLVSGRNPQVWLAFRDLLDDVAAYPNMKLILACRTFDLEHDSRLRNLGAQNSGFSTVPVAKLANENVRRAVEAGLGRATEFNESQTRILSVPFHLLLFLEGGASDEFQSVGELYNRYWNRKRQALSVRLSRQPAWNEVLDALTQSMSQRQVLVASKIVVDNWQNDAEAMASEHILVEDGARYRFFHESFFDYAFARRFCAAGRSALDLLKSGEQHLFRRGQVRQILAFRRENDFEQYLKDLDELLNDEGVRFHIKRMVASSLKTIENPTAEEWGGVAPHVLDGDLSRYVSTALRGHPEWFDTLNSLRVFETWLQGTDSRYLYAAIWFLEDSDLHDVRSEEIAPLITPFVDISVFWNERLKRVFSWGKAYKSSPMKEIYLHLVRTGVYDDFKGPHAGDSDFWSQHYNAEKECPKFIVEVLVAWFDRAVDLFDDGEKSNYLDGHHQNHSRVGAGLIGDAASKDPEYFIRCVLPSASATVIRTEIAGDPEFRDRTWPYLTNHSNHSDIDDAVLFWLRKSLQELAKTNAESFRIHVAPLLESRCRTFAYLLLRAWADNPKEFADECATYLIVESSRLGLGYLSWSGDTKGTGRAAITRLVLESITPFCSETNLRELEDAICRYTQLYEGGELKWRGYTELLLLLSIDQSRISRKAALRLEELERRLPNVGTKRVSEDEELSVDFVGPPIAEESASKMSNEHWIGAMRKYHSDDEDDFRDGSVELSRSLREFARQDRPRFASLAKKMDDEIAPVYFSSILDGLCGFGSNPSAEEKEAEQARIDNLPTETFVDVIDRLHALPGRPCGSAIAHCIQRLAKRDLPPHVLDCVAYYALNDPDPVEDTWTLAPEDSSGWNQDPHHQGINCCRGQAAEAIANLIFQRPTRSQRLISTLEKMSEDTVAAVRTCAIHAFSALWNSDRDKAVELFIRSCAGCEAICGTHPFENFVHYAIHGHYETLRELLQFALNSTVRDAVKHASRQIVLADLYGVDVGIDAERIRTGTETMRRAAVGIYSRNLLEENVADRCVAYLRQFFDDESEDVRKKISGCFWNMPGESLLKLQEFIAQFLETSCFEHGNEHLLRALENSNVDLPNVICRAAERTLEFLGEEGTHIAYHGSMIAHSISTLIVRQYEQSTDEPLKVRCLDLIDQMERVGYMGISTELDKIER